LAAAAGGGIWFASLEFTFLQINSTTFRNNTAGTALITQDHLSSGEAAGGGQKGLTRLVQASSLGASEEAAQGVIGSGGAVAAAGTIYVTLNKVIMANNTAARLGGGLYCHACLSLEVSKGSVSSNVLVKGSSRWFGNAAGAGGGAIATYMLKGVSRILDAEFTGNRAGLTSSRSASNSSNSSVGGPGCGNGGGGALCLQSLSENVAVSSSTFNKNTARFGGKGNSGT
jgi:predicted outer membrane repeat protein